MTEARAAKLQPGQVVRSVKYGDLLTVVSVEVVTYQTRFQSKPRLDVWIVVCRAPGDNFAQIPKDIELPA